MKKILPAILFGLLLLLIWEGIVDLLQVNPHILPAPSLIWSSFLDHFGDLLPHIGQTILETVIGLILAILLGVGLAVGISLSAVVRRAVYPLLIISQTIPLIAVAPLLL